MELPDFSVQGRSVLITGAGRGIGLAIAKALAAGGASVAIQDIERDVAAAEAESINQAGGRAIALGGDITDLTLPEQLIQQTTEQIGPIDILINNAAIQLFSDFFEHPIDEMRRQFDANVVAATRLCQLVIPAMRERRWGRVINIGSIQGKRGNAGSCSYAMTKAAIGNLTKGLARDFGRDGITVNCIAPGWFDTYRNRNDFKNEEEKLKQAKRVPIPRIGQAVDCAGVAVLLCSAAGEYITGQTFYVDGGMSIR